MKEFVSTLIPPKKIPSEVFEQIQDEQDLSDNQVKGMTQVFRQFCGPKSIEPGLEDIIKQHGEEILSFFDVSMEKMTVKVKGKSVEQDRALVYCKDVAGFINYVKLERKIQKDFDLKGQSKSYLKY